MKIICQYWQILNGHYECTDLFTLQNNIYINESIDSSIDSIASQIQPIASTSITENLTYDEIILPNGVLEYTIDVELYSKKYYCNTIIFISYKKCINYIKKLYS